MVFAAACAALATAPIVLLQSFGSPSVTRTTATFAVGLLVCCSAAYCRAPWSAGSVGVPPEGDTPAIAVEKLLSGSAVILTRGVAYDATLHSLADSKNWSDAERPLDLASPKKSSSPCEHDVHLLSIDMLPDRSNMKTSITGTSVAPALAVAHEASPRVLLPTPPSSLPPESPKLPTFVPPLPLPLLLPLPLPPPLPLSTPGGSPPKPDSVAPLPHAPSRATRATGRDREAAILIGARPVQGADPGPRAPETHASAVKQGSSAGMKESPLDQSSMAARRSTRWSSLGARKKDESSRAVARALSTRRTRSPSSRPDGKTIAATTAGG